MYLNLSLLFYSYVCTTRLSKQLLEFVMLCTYLVHACKLLDAYIDNCKLQIKCTATCVAAVCTVP